MPESPAESDGGPSDLEMATTPVLCVLHASAHLNSKRHACISVFLPLKVRVNVSTSYRETKQLIVCTNFSGQIYE